MVRQVDKMYYSNKVAKKFNLSPKVIHLAQSTMLLIWLYVLLQFDSFSYAVRRFIFSKRNVTITMFIVEFVFDLT